MRNNFIQYLTSAFEKAANAKRAEAMSAYMQNHFPFYGIPAPERKLIIQEALNLYKVKDADELHELLLELWDMPEREWQYCAMILMAKYKKMWNLQSLKVFEVMLINKSWWDTVDTLCSHAIGPYFKLFPESKQSSLNRWENEGNMWLSRTCIIHQLTYKNQTDTEYLTHIIFRERESKAFFIQKAIGWALRQYAKVNPQWVLNFVNANELKPLSRREALKNIKC